MNDTIPNFALEVFSVEGPRPLSPDAPRTSALDAELPLSIDAARVTLAWTDPEDGATLWIELWGSPALVAELVDQGFALRDAPGDDEFLDLPFLSAPPPSAGAHLRARILHHRTPGAG